MSSNLARRFDDLRGLVDDLHVALRTLDTAGMFYPKPDDVRADDLPLVTLRELEAMATAIHEDLRMIELGIYRITSKIIESARTGAIKQTSELLDRETSTTGGGRGPCDVLIVDDDHEVGELLAAYLATKHVSTRVVSRSSDYLADIRTANPRLVLLDVALSGKSGYDVCAGIKQDERMRDIRVLLFTAMPLAQVIAQLPACHADGYLLKPFTLNDVDRAIGIAGSWES